MYRRMLSSIFSVAALQSSVRWLKVESFFIQLLPSSRFLSSRGAAVPKLYRRWWASSSSDSDNRSEKFVPFLNDSSMNIVEFQHGNETMVNGVQQSTSPQIATSSHSSSPTTTSERSAPSVPPLDFTVVSVDPADIELRTYVDDDEDEQAQGTTISVPSALRNLPFVTMFRGSANYIASHRNTVAVIHLPGCVVEKSSFCEIMNDVALVWLLGMKIVLVTGCRYQVEKRSPEKDRHLGLLATNQEKLRLVKEEAGYIRFEVERQLARSLRMQGSAGGQGYYDGNVVSGNFYSAQPLGILNGIDYKYTGFVRRVEVDKVRQVLNSRDICLLTTLGVSPSGEVFNVNSESLAASVAGALQASKLIYFTEQHIEFRHRIHESHIQSFRISDARNLLKHWDISVSKKGYAVLGSNGATPLSQLDRPALSSLLKVGWSIQALEAGVKRAHLIAPRHGSLLQELYTRDGSGTLISGDIYEGIRRANENDVTAIHELIRPLIESGTLIDRPPEVLEKDIQNYYVFTRDNHIVATGQLKLFENGFAEIGCLVVNKDYRARGRGDAMLGYLERICLQQGCTKVFVLSTQTMEWFVERGFKEVGVPSLPPSRQSTYNYERNSKIYLKQIENLRDLDASELFWDR